MKNFCAYKVNSVGDLGWRESLTLISAGKNANDHSSVNHFATTIYQFIITESFGSHNIPT